MSDTSTIGTSAAIVALPQIRLLIAEDEEHLGAILEHFLRGRGYGVTMCRDGKSALAALQSDTYDVALIDIVMPEMDGLEVLRHLQAEPDPPEVIIITGNGTIDTAITAIKLGAYDYISKPYRMAEIDVMVRRAWEKRELTRANGLLRARTRHQLPVEVRAVYPKMVGLVAELTERAAAAEPIILHGPAGAGKTHLARYIHARSGRSHDAYAEVSWHDIGDTPGGVAALLFGNEPNAVRGVSVRRNGVLQRAEHGSVVIDAQMLDKQTRVLVADALVQRSFVRMGGTQRIPLTTRVLICDRESEGTGTFTGYHCTVPSLHERLEDIPLLASELARDVSNGAPRTVAPDAMPLLLQYGWPGNVSELRTVIARAEMLAPRSEISAADLRMVLIWGSGGESGGAPLSDLEKLHIEAMLVRTNWHQGRTAQALGISTKTLYRKMREYGFIRPRRRRLARGPGSSPTR